MTGLPKPFHYLLDEYFRSRCPGGNPKPGFIFKPGRINIIHPEYIKKVTFEQKEDQGRGTCSFESPAYRGLIAFDTKRKGEEWIITRFRIPEDPRETLLDWDGTWKSNLKAETGDSNFRKITFSPFEGPLGNAPLPKSNIYPQNPYRATTPEATVPVLKNLDTMSTNPFKLFAKNGAKEAKSGAAGR